MTEHRNGEGGGRYALFRVLEHRAFPDLAAALRPRLGDILEEWEATVRRVAPAAAGKSSETLRDHLVAVLPLMTDALGTGSGQEVRRLVEESLVQGSIRYQQHYEVRDLMLEDRVLRRVILRHAPLGLGRPMSDEENVGLNAVIDEFLQQAVVALVDRQREHLRAAAEAELRYLSFLSHDLNTHLGGLTLLLQLIKQQLTGSPQFAEQHQNIDQAQKLIVQTSAGMQRLLQAERLRKGAMKPKSEPVNLRALAEGAARQVSEQAKEKGLKVSVRVARDAVIESDPELVALALRNLLANAVKYSTTGTVRVESNPRQAGWWALSVSDQGPGIAPEHLGHVFEAFRRGETHGQEGVGLGLTIVSQAAKLLGAEVEAESVVGVGSTFRLVMPPTRSRGARELKG